MPLLKFHLVKGRTSCELDLLLDVAHEVMVDMLRCRRTIAIRSSRSVSSSTCEP